MEGTAQGRGGILIQEGINKWIWHLGTWVMVALAMLGEWLDLMVSGITVVPWGCTFPISSISLILTPCPTSPFPRQVLQAPREEV